VGLWKNGRNARLNLPVWNANLLWNYWWWKAEIQRKANEKEKHAYSVLIS